MQKSLILIQLLSREKKRTYSFQYNKLWVLLPSINSGIISCMGDKQLMDVINSSNKIEDKTILFGSNIIIHAESSSAIESL